MAAAKLGIYKGIQYRESKVEGLTIFEGYDRGYRVIYALSQREFRRKVSVYLKTGETNQATPWNRRRGNAYAR